jgi:hypothetical protein
MTDKRRHSKALRELEDTKILVDYLMDQGLSFDVLDNFSDGTVKKAKEWFKGRTDLNDQDSERLE